MPPRQDGRREARLYAELALCGRRLEYQCWIEPEGHRERLTVLAGYVRRRTGADLAPLLAEVHEALDAGDDEAAVVSDAAREILRELHAAIGRALRE